MTDRRVGLLLILLPAFGLLLLVSDFHASRAFYLAALEPLGYEGIMEISRERYPSLPFAFGVGLGVGGYNVEAVKHDPE